MTIKQRFIFFQVSLHLFTSVHFSVCRVEYVVIPQMAVFVGGHVTSDDVADYVDEIGRHQHLLFDFWPAEFHEAVEQILHVLLESDVRGRHGLDVLAENAKDGGDVHTVYRQSNGCTFI